MSTDFSTKLVTVLARTLHNKGIIDFREDYLLGVGPVALAAKASGNNAEAERLLDYISKCRAAFEQGDGPA